MKSCARLENACPVSMNDMMHEKRCLRKTVFCADTQHDAAARAQQDRYICETLQKKIPPKSTVLCFMPLRDEVNIRPLYEVIWRTGGRVILPYCIDSAHMLLKPYEPDTPLCRDAMHVPAPCGATNIAPQSIDVALVPAVAFTAQGARLGRGGGFYDRFLPQLRDDALKIGVCYSWRLQTSLPEDIHDWRVDFVVSGQAG